MAAWSVCVGLALLAVAALSGTARGQCVPQSFEYDSFVCVCNATYCDEIGVVDPPEAGTYILYTTTRDSERLTPSSGAVDAAPGTSGNTVAVNTANQYQTMIGFGGGFTDAGGLNLNTLSDEAKELALRSYFAPEGIGYNLMRVPIAGCDCSTRPYSYDDVEGDVDLVFWALEPEDYDYKLPIIKRALELSPREVLIFGSPWSAPTWMKTNGMFNGSGFLLPEMWQPWANYIVKFVEAYEAEGVPLWGLTPQNEPLTGVEDWRWNSMAWTPEDMRDWIKTALGPTLEAAGLRRLAMMTWDFNRDGLVAFIEPILADADASQYIDGIAVHWYSDLAVGPEPLQEAHDLDPSKFILYTEACEGIDVEGVGSVKLGAWYRAEHYLGNIILDMNNWSTGWVEWNLSLDMQGGPNWASSFLDSPIIVNVETDEFYKQPMHYAIAHVSKFIERGAVRVDAVPSAAGLRTTAVVNPSGEVVVVVLNLDETAVPEVTIAIDDARYVTVDIPAKSFQTFVVSTT